MQTAEANREHNSQINRTLALSNHIRKDVQRRNLATIQQRRSLATDHINRQHQRKSQQVQDMRGLREQLSLERRNLR